MSALTVLGSTARRDGQVVASLRWAGKVVTVRARNRALGRLIPVGYLQGSLDDPEHFDVWTAKHPAVHTPSDTTLAYGLGLAEAVNFLLGL